MIYIRISFLCEREGYIASIQLAFRLFIVHELKVALILVGTRCYLLYYRDSRRATSSRAAEEEEALVTSRL